MSRGGTRVYFGRLPRDVRERDIEKLIRGYGSYREISIKLGYGFVVSDPFQRSSSSRMKPTEYLTFSSIFRNFMNQTTLMIVFMI